MERRANRRGLRESKLSNYCLRVSSRSTRPRRFLGIHSIAQVKVVRIQHLAYQQLPSLSSILTLQQTPPLPNSSSSALCSRIRRITYREILLRPLRPNRFTRWRCKGENLKTEAIINLSSNGTLDRTADRAISSERALQSNHLNTKQIWASLAA